MRTVFGMRGRTAPGPVGLAAIADLVEYDASTMDDLALLDAASNFARQVNWLNSCRADLLAELAARDSARDARPDTSGSGKQWLATEVAMMTGLADDSARAQLRTATALAARLPLTAGLLRTGQLSWAHAHEMATVTAAVDDAAAGEVERRVLADPTVLTPFQLRQTAKRHVMALAPVKAKENTPCPSAASFIDREGNNRFTATLEPLGAQVVADAVESAATKTGSDDDRPIAHRRADGLVEIAAFWLAHAGSQARSTERGGSGGSGGSGRHGGGGHGGGGFGESGGDTFGDGCMPSPGSAGSDRFGSGGHRPQLTVSVSLSTLLGLTEEPGLLAGGQYVCADTARRLACDAGLTRLVREPMNGGVIDLGRTSRFPSLRQRRRILARDRGCRFPNCNRGVSRVDIHHIQEWVSDGRTDERNLLAACPRHHTLVHEGGWSVRLEDDNSVVWTSPTMRDYVSPAPFADPPGSDVPDIDCDCDCDCDSCDAGRSDAEPPDRDRPDSGGGC